MKYYAFILTSCLIIVIQACGGNTKKEVKNDNQPSKDNTVTG